MEMYKFSQQAAQRVLILVAIVIKLLTPISTTFSIMCWLTESFHTTCSHWGRRLVETPCARGENSGTGCWDNTISGVLRLEVLCPACRYGGRIGGRTTPSSTFTHRTQSAEEGEPLSRNSISSKLLVLVLENQVLDKVAAKKEGELIGEWEGSWEMVEKGEVEGEKEGGESEGEQENGASFGKWVAWRGYKS